MLFLTLHMDFQHSIREVSGDFTRNVSRLKKQIVHFNIIQNGTSSDSMIGRMKSNIYYCTVCARVFNDRGNLARHKETHGGKGRFQCSFCNKTFHQKINLKTHTYVHQGLRPYRCTICRRGFRQQTHLKNHRCIILAGEDTKGWKECAFSSCGTRFRAPYRNNCTLCERHSRENRSTKVLVY
mmetsp:Transcript_24215/g.36310  ORF Transcript_24215/g.36310 Transcript_24215/m.36310 type:complete len:182 (+) Transcript_24215:165-710(+)